jgi:aspartyl-tRNA(Asn)/glutamyl-tRNA(Gln) amidotransferase subunit B
MNSFRNVQRAVEAEIERQIGLVEANQPVNHETMMFDANKGITRPMRTKEDAHDYRYFPEPDLLPVTITSEYIEETRTQIPELQRERRDRFVREYALPKYDADVLTVDAAIADFFENAVIALEDRAAENIKAISNYTMGDVMRMLTERKSSIATLGLDPRHLAELITLVSKEVISNKIGKDLLPDLLGSAKSPKQIVEERGMVQVSDEGALRAAIRSVVATNADNLAKYKAGKVALLGFFVGQTMKTMGGKANPTLLNQLVKEELENA